MSPTPIAVTLVPATAADEATLANLMQLYIYDFSDLLGLDVADSGRFPVRPVAAYFSDPLHRVFLLRAGGKLAGFVIVDLRSRLSGEEGVADMEEFFVLRRHRGQGVGAQAAALAFAAFPGRWEVRQVPQNTGAITFWRKTIGRYTGGRFTETFSDSPRWHGPVQSFASTSPHRSGSETG